MTQTKKETFNSISSISNLSNDMKTMKDDIRELKETQKGAIESINKGFTNQVEQTDRGFKKQKENILEVTLSIFERLDKNEESLKKFNQNFLEFVKYISIQLDDYIKSQQCRIEEEDKKINSILDSINNSNENNIRIKAEQTVFEEIFREKCIFLNELIQRQLRIPPEIQCFLDGKEQLKQIISAIEDAKQSILIAVFNINHFEILDALINVDNNIQITIFTDVRNTGSSKKTSGNNAGNSTVVEKINLIERKNNKNIIRKINIDPNGTANMHLKEMIIDEKILFCGSANYTKNAFENSVESLYKMNQFHNSKT